VFSDEIKLQMFKQPWIETVQRGAQEGELRPLHEYDKDRLFGIEIELEGLEFPQRVPGWMAHNEGSLRGGGIEYVTDGPVTFEGVHKYLKSLNSKLVANGSKIRETYRASTHIHYNVQNRTLDHILKSIIVFMCYEPLICELCGPERNGNLFCLPTYDCGDMTLWLQEFLKKLSGPAKTLVPFRYLQRGKYSALNTDPLTKFGTLECRVFPSTINVDAIYSWCSWLHEILGQPIDSVSDYVRSLEGSAFNPRGEISRIFKDAELPGHARSLIGFGTEQAWPLAMVYERALK